MDILQILRAIKNIFKNKKIKIIEDCAQAHGSKIKINMWELLVILVHLVFFQEKILELMVMRGGIITNKIDLKKKCS